MTEATAWLNRERLVQGLGVLLLTFSLVLYSTYLWEAWSPIVEGQSLWAPRVTNPVALDFPAHWTASYLALTGEAALVYNSDYYGTMEQALTGTGPHPWFYPPTALLIDLPLALLPYFVSLSVWLAVTLSLYLMVLYCTAPQRFALLWALAFFGTFQNFFFGQNGFISAGLLGSGLLLLSPAPFLGGLFLGLVSYKPHLAVLIPLALVAGRQWRALGGAALAAAALALLSVLIFCWDIWRVFVTSIPKTAGNLPAQAVWFNKMPSVLAAARLAGCSATTAWIFHSLSMLAGLGLVVWMWAGGRASVALRAAALVVGILLFSPHIWYYDVALLAVALAWLWQEANRGGWLPLEKLLLLLAWFTPLLTFLMMVGLQLSVGPLYLAMTIVVLVRRYYWERTAAGHAQAAPGGPAVKSDRPGRN